MAKMAVFLLLNVMMMIVVRASSTARFQSVPAFHNNKIESKPNGCSRKAFSAVLSSQEQHRTKLLSIRCGAQEEEVEESDAELGDDDEAVATDDVEEDKPSSEDEDETDVSSDEDDYYDEETEEEEEESTELEEASSSSDKASEPFVEPYFISPSLQMYTTFGTILLSRKIDMLNPKMVRLIRFMFIVYLLVQQAFIFYVRIMAKRNNDRTPVQVQNPLTSMLSSQLEKQQAGANDMVKNLASSFLKTESTVTEYDMGQARNMQGGILFNIVFMWFLHFKMQQVQPLLVTTVSGLVQLAYNPLFQVYVMGRNLERPFKSPEVFKDPRAEENESPTDETTTEAETTETSTEDGEAEANDDVDEESEEESSDNEDEDSADEIEESSEEEDDNE